MPGDMRDDGGRPLGTAPAKPSPPPPGRDSGASSVDQATDHVGYVGHFRRRVMQDALVESLPGYWRRRADTFDQVGTSACDDIATACRRHADLVEQTGLPADVLAELAAELDGVT